MDKKILPTAIIATACVTVYLMGWNFGFSRETGAESRLLYSFAHANVFHLAINMIALIQFRPRVKTAIIAYMAATTAAFIPFTEMQMQTCGLSGFLMACYARKYQAYKKNIIRIIIPNMAMAFIPLFNWKIHIASFLISYIIYATIQYIRIHEGNRGNPERE